MTIIITTDHGHIDSDDEARARAAAEAVFQAAAIDPLAAQADYDRQSADYDSLDLAADLTGDAAVFFAAERAADLAATEG